MKNPDWMERRGLTWPDIIKISLCMGSLLAFVIIMSIGAIGALIY